VGVPVAEPVEEVIGKENQPAPPPK
jgi:hypothetical protein